MTPKEKAIELVDTFTFTCRECDYVDNAKQCALIAVDEILNSNPFEWVGNWQSTVDYWEEVKQELNNL